MPSEQVMPASAADTTRVLFIDNHPLLRHGARAIFEDAGDILLVGEAGSLGEAIPLLEREPFDLVVLDTSLPDREGLDAVAELRQVRARLPILVLVLRHEEHLGVRFLRAGARGVLCKDVPPQELVTAVRRIRAGNRYMSEALNERLLNSWQKPGDRPLHEQLSDREFQVLRLIAAGKTAREISVALSITANTVGTYRKRLLAKMHVRSNVELMRYALEHQIVE